MYVGGNPKPSVTWLGQNSTPLKSRDGRLEVREVTLDDVGEYTCIGRNLLGIASQTAILNVKESKFHFTSFSIDGRQSELVLWNLDFQGTGLNDRGCCPRPGCSKTD